MQKLFLLLRRSANEGPEAFHDRYLIERPRRRWEHAGIRRYTAHLLDVPAAMLAAGLRLGAPAFDAADALWLEGAADLAALTAGEALQAAYRVVEHVQRDAPCTGADSERTPGIKLLYLIHRAEGLSRAQFAVHWLHRHGPLALEHHPGMCRYVQNPVLQALTPDAPPLDGIAELHFATEQDLQQRLYDSPEGRALIGADVARFIARGSGGGYAVSEYVQWG